MILQLLNAMSRRKLLFYTVVMMYLWCLFSARLYGQQGSYNMVQYPDCQFYFNLTTATSTAEYDNRTRGCTDFAIAYNSTGFTGLTITVQVAPNSSGSPGTWATYTAATGSNPSTATTQANATFTDYFPFVRVTLSGLTGTGTVSGTVYGWRFRNGGGAAGGGCTAPCVVIGPDAVGSPSTEPPVQVAGNDGTNVRAIKTDTAGNSTVVGPGASGAALSGNPVRVGLSDTTNTQNWLTASSLADAGTAAGAGAMGLVLFNGTTWDRARGGTAGMFVQGPIASGTTSTANPVIVGGVIQSGTAARQVAMVSQTAGYSFATSPGVNISGGYQPLAIDFSGGIKQYSTGAAMADAASNTASVFGTANSPFFAYQPTLGHLYNRVAGSWDRMNGTSTAGIQVGGLGSGATSTMYQMTACDSSAVINVTAGTTVELVALTASRSVRVCGFTMTADTALTIATWQYGTGATCGTGTTNLSGPMDMGVNTVVSLGSGLGELFKTPVSNALCLAAAVGNVRGVVSYAKY